MPVPDRCAGYWIETGSIWHPSPLKFLRKWLPLSRSLAIEVDELRRWFLACIFGQGGQEVEGQRATWWQFSRWNWRRFSPFHPPRLRVIL